MYEIAPVGYVRSALKNRHGAPRQGWEGAPDAELEILPEFFLALEGVEAGQEVWVLTWLHQAERSTLKVHPRDQMDKPKLGVFATRSPDRPNPIGLHRVLISDLSAGRLMVRGFEAIDGTPIIDIKPVLRRDETF